MMLLLLRHCDYKQQAQGLYELNSFTDAFATAEMILKVEPEYLGRF